MTEGAGTSKQPSGRKDLANQPWVEKYRPKTLDDVAAHKEIIDTIKRLTAENRLPHLLLYGPPGTGKTSTVLAIAAKLYGAHAHNMVLELNASDDRGIGVVRQEIQDFASTKSVFCRNFKLIVLDECDAMTKDAQFALRRVIEKYARNARFCLICNHVSKIIPALQSRCTRFRFPPLPQEFVQRRVREICDLEGIDVDPTGTEAVCKLGRGDMRQTLNILQSTFMAHGHIDEEAAYLCTGNPTPQQIEQIVTWLLNDSMSVAYEKLHAQQIERGFALVDIIREMHTWIFAIDLPAQARQGLVVALADIEYNLSVGTNPRLQLAAVVGAFAVARNLAVAAVKS